MTRHEHLIADLCARPGVRDKGFPAAWRHYFGYDHGTAAGAVMVEEFALPRLLPDAWRVYLRPGPTMIVWEVHVSHVRPDKWFDYMEYCDAWDYGFLEIHVDRHGAESIGMVCGTGVELIDRITTPDAKARNLAHCERIASASLDGVAELETYPCLSV